MSRLVAQEAEHQVARMLGSLFGNEFGGERNAYNSLSAFPNGGYRFPARSPREGRGNAGYWIFPTLKTLQPEIRRRWKDAVDKVMDNWARNS
jgi:hypothetical protein